MKNIFIRIASQLIDFQYIFWLFYFLTIYFVLHVWRCERLKHIFAPSKGITFDVFNNYLNSKL